MVPMEIVRVIPSVLGILKIPIDLYKGDKKLERQMKHGLESLKDELESLKHDLEFNKEGWKSYDELRLTELVYDIEDFAQGLWIPGVSGPLLSVIGMNPCAKHVEGIKLFKEKIKLLKDSKQKDSGSKSEQDGGCSADTTASSEAQKIQKSEQHEGYAPEESLVGIAKPKKVLLDLLKKPAASGQKPKVISIVGCPGVGKTTFARAVYNYCGASRDFDCVAWVKASRCDNRTALLGKIHENVKADLAGKASLAQKISDFGRKIFEGVKMRGNDDTACALQNILADKRYLVFIDDVHQAEVWDDTVGYFPENGKSSMIVLTTSVHSVANVCGSRPGSYVYKMQCLPQQESEDLFWASVYPDESKPVAAPSSALDKGSESIISKCDGLPLALISVAKYLRITKGKKLDGDDCVRLGEELGRHLVGEEAEEGFGELRRALWQCYEDLPGYEHKNCMLSLSIFPRNRPIKRKSLVRRLIAEGLVDIDGNECFDELIQLINRGQDCLEGLLNRCIIVEPVEICSWSKDAKCCRVNGGIMLEYIVHKSLSTNFVTLIRDGKVLRNKQGRIRRLSVQSRIKDEVDDIAQGIELSDTIRSLTIILSEQRSDLFQIIKNCKFLRLLDLEGCWGLDGDLLRAICGLVYLKYLSLRKTDVKNIPQQIEKLQCLQTLDIRETTEIKLPIEVIMLPKLVFLFGHFVLPEMTSNTTEFLKRESKLHTFGEFVVHKEGSEHNILEAKNLKKVKVWCRDTYAPTKSQTSFREKVVSSISKVIPKSSPFGTKEDFVSSLQRRFVSLHSVSIRSSELSQDILSSLEMKKGHSTISRMKLWGKLVRLPCTGMLSQLNNLRKLQLSYTGLTSEDLSSLQHLPELEYLKLLDNKKDSWVGSFVVRADGFPSLRRLCFHASKLPKLEFDTASMKSLTSLQLLCPKVSQMQVVEEICKSISHITKLNEVILHSSATTEIVEAWETAAKSNANRPCVNIEEATKPIRVAA